MTYLNLYMFMIKADTVGTQCFFPWRVKLKRTGADTCTVFF